MLASLGASDPGLGQEAADRKAWFGEQHIHTSWSVDAWLFGNHTTGPDDALKYARGETIKHPLGYDITIDKPLDWMGVTDHSEYVGITKQANTPGTAVSKMPQARPLILKDPNDPADVQKVFNYLVSLVSKPPIKAFMTPQVAGSVWKDNVDIANKHNKPGEFTAFCSYEFTSQYDLRNLHRNVYFRDCAKVPEQPYSALFSWHPEDLWKWMDEQRAAGNELLAISHNANLSDGWMYPTDVDSLGRPIDAAWAESRTRNERLIEIKQIKGQSETHPLLSPNDEFANYEIMSFLIGQPEDSGRVPAIVGSYARQALKDGLTMQHAKGYNPFKFGFVAGSDSHNTGAPYRTNNAFAGHGINDGLVQRRMSGHLFTGMDVRKESTAGLSAVWAEENTRESIWDAMHRRETFGTSGVWIQVRMFGGWDYGEDLLQDAEWVAKAYERGTPMGGDLAAAPADAKAPSFLVWAVKDPDSGNLDRIQIVKGWTKAGQSFEKVYDVVWAGDREPAPDTGRLPPLPSTVDLTTATYSDEQGATELFTVWTDPDFDPDLNAFYYARVLEIETPRWTTVQAVKLGVELPDVVPATVQERAWGSPIWYTSPSDSAAASDAVTVASLEESGATALTDDELAALIVDKAIWIRNNVTGEVMKVHYDKSGTFDVNYVGSRAQMPSLHGDLPRESYLVLARPYTIADGQINTFVSSTPIGMKVYKTAGAQGGNTHKEHATYYGARSNEFGYANYEVLLKGPGNLVDLPKDKMDIPAGEQPKYLHETVEQ
ncbi:DUF3604 domain-containing protein [Rhizobiales bacterium]|uniref:DUF3604 domain-containing protein n=1 Tax=Hongsoonwoonella zoysiae TaxID=2821844 RepID=UPI00155FC5F5|nr:DUF3604 domain-containing protein [Hongsoonwoonella zoysiae]NRG16089.1 DUF3604 domain-containing protein [Hongsoonwoonella zoysiae]